MTHFLSYANAVLWCNSCKLHCYVAAPTYKYIGYIHRSTDYGLRLRVDRVLGFFPVVRIGTPTPSPAGECVPIVSEGDTLAGRRGRGGSQFGRGDRHCGTLGTLWVEGTVQQMFQRKSSGCKNTRAYSRVLYVDASDNVQCATRMVNNGCCRCAKYICTVEHENII